MSQDTNSNSLTTAEALFERAVAHHAANRLALAYKLFERAMPTFEAETPQDDFAALFDLGKKFERASFSAYRLHYKGATGKNSKDTVWLARANKLCLRGAELIEQAFKLRRGEKMIDERFAFFLYHIRLSGELLRAKQFDDAAVWAQKGLNAHFQLGQLSASPPRELWLRVHHLLADAQVGQGKISQALDTVEGGISSVAAHRERRAEILKDYAALCQLKFEILSR